MILIDILECITKHREARNWTEYKLAEMADLPQSTISSWYKKKMLPSIASLEKICNAFDISMSEFFVEKETLYPLTSEQKTLINKWSYLNKEQKEILLKLIEIL